MYLFIFIICIHNNTITKHNNEIILKQYYAPTT